MKDSDPWFDTRSPKDLILEREQVSALTREVVEKLVSDGQAAIRTKNLNGLMALFALDFRFEAPEIKNGKHELVLGNRDRYQLNMASVLSRSTCNDYSMKVASVELTSNETAEVTIIVQNPGDEEFTKIYGSDVHERISVSLYRGRPVISRLRIEKAA